MTTAQRPASIEAMSKNAREALVDQLRACSSTKEILDFENWFNSQASAGPLFEVICEFLRNRSISRVLAAKWLSVLLNDKENRLKE